MSCSRRRGGDGGLLSQVLPTVCCVLQLARNVSPTTGTPPKPMHCPAWLRAGTLLDTVAECHTAPIIGGLLVPGLAKGLCSPAAVQMDRGTGKMLECNACTTAAFESVPGEVKGHLWLGWAYFSMKVPSPWHQGVCFDLPMVFCA